MHDLYTSSINAIDKLIPKLLEKGYMPVTVSELFYYYNIELKEGKVYSHARWYILLSILYTIKWQIYLLRENLMIYLIHNIWGLLC